MQSERGAIADVPHALLVDLYELTMADAYRRHGMAGRPATFSLYVRSLPPERSYLVAAGLDDALTWLERLSFAPAELAVVERLGLFPAEFLDHLAALRFTGRVRAVPEGTIVFAGEPLLEVDAPIDEGQLAETFLLNQLTLQTMLATKASRFREAASGRALVEFAFRRAHGIDAGMKLVRVCALVGFDGTSNVAGADRYGVPASGTMAHAFVQAHEDEVAAFRAFAEALRERAVLVVDTYDTARGVERAIEVAGEMRARGIEIKGIRLDSGDLARLAAAARQRLDEAGFPNLQILASGGLDEHAVAGLVHVDQAPIDGFGVGTALGASTDAAALESVYKLVAHEGRMVRKTSTGKASWPGPKQVWRAPDWSEDVLTLADEPHPAAGYEPLLEEVARDGRRTGAGQRDMPAANRHFEQGWDRLPARLRRLEEPDRHRVRVSAAVRRAAEEIDRRHQEE